MSENENKNESENPIERIGVFKNDLSLENENLVSAVTGSYKAEINKRQRAAEEKIERTRAQLKEKEEKHNRGVKESGGIHYKDLIRLLLESLRQLKITAQVAEVNSMYVPEDAGSSACVKTWIKLHWDAGNLSHQVQRKLTAEEKRELRELDALRELIAGLEKYLVTLRARKGEILDLADDVRGIKARRVLEKADPEMLKKLDELIKKDNYRLPELPS